MWTRTWTENVYRVYVTTVHKGSHKEVS